MDLRLSIEDVAGDFPAFRVAAVLATGLRIQETRPRELDALIAEREAACRQRFGDDQMGQIPGVAAWRRAYRQFGIKKTSYRSSVERLVRNVLAGRPLPSINSFVDAYNAVSLAHLFPVGADDLDRIDHQAAFRYARDGDSFFALGQEGAQNDPPKIGEVVLAAGANVLCRRWNWYQDARSPITANTTRAFVTIQSNGEGDLTAATEDLVDLLARFADAKCSVALASSDNQMVELSGS